MTDYPPPRPMDNRPFLSLVDRDLLSSMGNIPREIWEPMSLQYTEADCAITRVEALQLAPKLEPVRQLVLEKWGRVIGWLDEILIKSQSVNALRSWQMVQALRPDDNMTRPLAGLVPMAPGPAKEVKRGLRR